MSEPKRIVSMLASGTELVCALGLGDRLVGRSHECDFPEWVTSLPAVSAPTFDISGSSCEIDECVRRKLRAGEPLYRVDEAQLLELMPDLLITQTHCEVCAVSPADLAHHQPRSLERRPIVALSGGTIAAILQGFCEVAAAVGRPAAGAELVALLERRLEDVRQRVHGLPRPSVVCLEWIEPPFAMGNWGPELVEIAGGRNLLGALNRHSISIDFGAVLEADPDVLIVAPCGFGLERTRAELSRLSELPGFNSLRAAKAGRLYFADGNRYFNRSSPSLFDTPAILAEMLHPEHFAPHHEGLAWARFGCPPRALSSLEHRTV